MRLQPQVKKEFTYVSVGTGVLTVMMIVAFAVLHFAVSVKIPFDTRVLLGGVCGALVAVGCFLDLALCVQKVAAMESGSASAELAFRRGYSRRMLVHGAWVIIALKVSWFNPVAALIPLTFPRIMILTRKRSASDPGKEASNGL